MIRLFACLSFAFFMLLAAPVHAQTAPDKVLDIKAFTTPAGIKVWLVEDHSIPVISLNFSFEGGLAHDPEGKPGVARLVSILLDEGAENMDSQAFQAKMTDNAISMGFTAGRDAFFGELRTITDNRALAFDLLRAALTAPRFDEDAIERMKNANAAQIKRDMGDPAWLSARTFNGVMFEGHPYALPGYGNLASMQKITKKDLINFTRAQFSRDVLQVALAGDITAAEATTLIDKTFGGLPAKGVTIEGRDITPQYPGKTILLPLDTPQTYIAIGAPGIPRADNDWHAAVVMNYILGGGSFDSWLMTEVREKRGLTYGIYSSLQSMKHAAISQISLSSSNEHAAEALSIIRAQLKRMAENGPTEQELKDAKAYLTGSLMLELTSTGDIAGVLNGLQRDDMDAEYINRRNAMLNAITLADVRRVAKRLLKTDQLTTVLVGKPDNVKADIMLDKPPGMAQPETK